MYSFMGKNAVVEKDIKYESDYFNITDKRYLWEVQRNHFL